MVVQRPALLAHVHAADVATARGLPAVFAVLGLGAYMTIGVELLHLALLAESAPPLLFDAGNLVVGGVHSTAGGNAPATNGMRVHMRGSTVADQLAANTRKGRLSQRD